MLVNRELKQTIIFCVIVLAVGIYAIHKIPEHGGKILFLTGCLLLVSFIVLEWRRYNKISHLSRYLNQVSNGDYMLDIRDNEEGELSILKNEIYKVTLMLAEQAELLKRDKMYLADSIADISHQLKTPLTSMMVMSELLADGSLNADKREEFTGLIRRQLTRIDWLVSSLLKLSKIDAGTIQMKKEVVLITSVLKSALQPLLISAELKNLTIVQEGEPETSYIGDYDWSKEAFTNLLKNCIEHSNEGGTLKIHYITNTLYTEIIIEDNGEGINSEDIPHIFERFYRGKNASSDSVGIGLAMAKNIFLKQGGRIEVKSKKGIGTKFTIRIYKTVI